MSSHRYIPSSSKRDREDEKSRRDKEERDRFDERIRLREEERTKKLAAKTESRSLEVVAKKLKLDPRKDKLAIIELERKKSRQQYLISRSDKQYKLLEADIRDEKALFDEKELSSKELKDREFKEKILVSAKNVLDADIKSKIQQYHIPDSSGVNDEYLERQDQERPANYDEKLWEEVRIKSNMRKPRYKDNFEQQFGDKEKYDILMEDTEFLDMIMREPNLEQSLIDKKTLAQETKRRERQKIEETRKALPVYQFRQELLEAIKENRVIIIQGETGCGKTTQIPQYLHEEGFTKTEMKDGETKMIGCTQPRRVAAMAVASRVSQELGTKLGHSVGYSIRFEDCTSEGTVIKYMTDGMLLRELLDDPTLDKYSVMIIDEAHERTLHTDILLTLVKDVTRARSDFRLIISSATLDEEKFGQFFENPPIYRIKGRRFRVETHFLNYSEDRASVDYMDASLRTIIQIHRTGEPGDILVFLPGQDEIETLQRNLEDVIKKLGKKIGELLLRPIYANLPTDLQAKVFEKTPRNSRKVVLATNIAETSLTIDGIVYVIDPGFCKQNKFNSKSCMETLAITRISKASADQRAGRAGRVQAGHCYRLYTKQEYEEDFADNTTPEIQRVNLGNVVLLLKTMQISDVINFEYMDKPPRDTLIFALEQLKALGALDMNGDLTLLGRRMAEFPLDPKMSKAIIASESFGCSEDVVTIMSMLSVNASIFFKPKEKAMLADAARKCFFSVTGDHLMMLRVYDDWAANNFSSQWCYEKFVQFKSMCRARDIRDQLEKLCEKAEVNLISKSSETADIRKAILSGFFYNVAKISREGGSYRTIRKHQCVYIHPSSCLHGDMPPRWLVYNEVMLTSKEYMRLISEIEPSWLAEVAPSFYKAQDIEELAKKKMPKIIKGKSKAALNPTYGR